MSFVIMTREEGDALYVAARITRHQRGDNYPNIHILDSAISKLDRASVIYFEDSKDAHSTTNE